ncbi:glycerol-3-phosphate cytidylyltransferase [Alkalibacterium putridalgicola]|uniref:Cytidyltransferase n=1 Tax=Alkalibacterium putridalgicola TaxID=426703 RepID=A0A1H7QLV7_9LACT|nr:adenylyltransferase/cytidyltransferase family protein [Alkalibacterium putridalgicola]GEK88409.1 cytidyltransferase [Alkalibacterium putridalgicola]SEL49070.1 glycerol-3-phosphate cytidylyltransferase [Alkalibacterium putridalgicola]
MTKIVGYTTGVFDLFHIGHLNVIKKAHENCDYLIVGVTTDEEVERVKKKKPIIPYEERAEIVKAIRYVDEVVPENDTDKLKAAEAITFNRIFKGDDWKGTPKWNRYEEEFNKKNIDVMYFPYTKGTSSTHLRNVLDNLMKQ